MYLDYCPYTNIMDSDLLFIIPLSFFFFVSLLLAVLLKMTPFLNRLCPSLFATQRAVNLTWPALCPSSPTSIFFFKPCLTFICPCFAFTSLSLFFFFSFLFLCCVQLLSLCPSRLALASARPVSSATLSSLTTVLLRLMGTAHVRLLLHQRC